VLCHIYFTLCTDNYKFHSITLTIRLIRSSNHKPWSSINAPHHSFCCYLCVGMYFSECEFAKWNWRGWGPGAYGVLGRMGVVNCNLMCQNVLFSSVNSFETSSINITHYNFCFPILGVITRNIVQVACSFHFIVHRFIIKPDSITDNWPRREFPSAHACHTPQCIEGSIQWLAWKFVFVLLWHIYIHL